MIEICNAGVYEGFQDQSEQYEDVEMLVCLDYGVQARLAVGTLLRIARDHSGAGKWGISLHSLDTRYTQHGRARQRLISR